MSFGDLDKYLNSEQADFGLTIQARRVISQLKPADEDDVYKYFANIILSPPPQEDENNVDDDETCQSQQHAARSYRAMTILKQDLLREHGQQALIINTPTRASLLAKDLLNGLPNCTSSRRQYSIVHIRTVLDALLETFPAAVVSAAAAGGIQGMDAHLAPLLLPDSASETLPLLTHLVCLGCTGRKGIASAEKSVQHTFQGMHSADAKANISRGHRRKFVKSMADWGLLTRLAECLVSSGADSRNNSTVLGAGEDACETALTILECVGYPPEHEVQAAKKDNNGKLENVGEDVLLAPLGTSEWWGTLLGSLAAQQPTQEQDETTNTTKAAIARLAFQSFALATGNSSRICKSHAPATDATEQTEEKLVEEEEETLTNRLTEWGLTDKMHLALVTHLPLLIQLLDLPKESMTYQGTKSTHGDENSEEKEEDLFLVRHPGRYQTIPLSSWRHQLLMLLKEILIYRGSKTNSDYAKSPRPSLEAMNAIMNLTVLPPEVEKKKKADSAAADQDDITTTTTTDVIYNPWPALCSLVFCYPHNDLYHIQFFHMFRAICLEHHEPTLRLVLQRAKFVTRAVRDCDPTSSSSLAGGILLNCLNVLRLRRESLPPSAYLRQFLDSHDIWKGFQDKLVEITMNQQTPIKGDIVTSIDLGSPYANKLGFEEISEWDGTTVAAEETTAPLPTADDAEKTTGKKKKKNKKKKKK